MQVTKCESILLNCKEHKVHEYGAISDYDDEDENNFYKIFRKPNLVNITEVIVQFML